MKLLLSFFLLILFISGCSEKKEEKNNELMGENIYTVDTTDIKTIPAEDPGKNFLMRYKFKLNEEYKYRILIKTDTKQTIKADTTITQDLNQETIYLVNFKAKEFDQDSIYDITCTFSSIKLDANADGELHSYQSGLTKDSTELLKFANFEALVNNPFNIRIDNSGNILEIYKTDKIISRFLDLQNLKDSVSTEDKNYLKEQISQGAIKPIISQIFRKLPDKMVAKDSVWTISQPSTQYLVFQVSSNNIYKVNSLEEFNDDDIAVIDAKLDSKATGETKLTEQGVNYEFNKPVSEAEGKIYFNIEKGNVLKAKVKSRISVFYTMEGDTPMGKQKGSRSDIMEYTNIVELL